MALMTYDEFEKKYIGKAVDYDKTAGIQCVDIVDQYLKDCFGITGVWVDGAKDLYDKFNNYPALVKAFNRVPNTDDLVVKKGDIIVWGGGSWGHTGIGNGKGDVNYFVSLEENTLGQHEPTQLVKHYFANDVSNPVLGVLRPKDRSQIDPTAKKPTTPTTPTTPTNKNGYSNSPLATKKNLFTQNYNDRGGKKIDRITVHHMAGNLTIDGCKNALQSRGGSVNYAIQSDGTIGLLLPEKFRPWTSNSPDNDYFSVTIEVANAPGAGEPDWKVTDAALQSTIKLCADICKRNGIKKLTFTGQLAGSNLTMHKWFYATGCPGKYLGGKFPYIVQEVNKILNGSNSSATTTPTTPATPTPTVSYKTMYVNAKDGLNYRDKPSGNIRGAYKNGTLVRYVVGSETKTGGYTWVKMDNGFYIAKDYLSEKKPSTTTKKSNTEIAKEVIAGKWGNGEERVKKLTAAGYNASEVQKEVNKLLKG